MVGVHMYGSIFGGPSRTMVKGGRGTGFVQFVKFNEILRAPNSF